MSEDFAAFVPRRCLEPRLFPPDSRLHRESAATLFVDLAGFTPLTERLAGLGSRGTEELSGLMRRFFAAVTDAVLDRGGDPVAYGGDALTVVFDGPRKPALAAAAGAAEAIIDVAASTAGPSTAVGAVRLQAKIGLARGPVTTAVAHASRRSVAVHLGEGLDRAVEAEATAAPGQVVVHPTARAHTGQVQSSDPLGAAGPASRTGAHQDARRERRGSGSTRPMQAQVARLVHPVVRGRLSVGTALLESHRTVTVAFVHFPPVRSTALPTFLHAVGGLLELVDAVEGEVVQVSGGDKGVVAMLVFGAPVAHPDDALRAVETLLAFRRSAPAIGCGVATGPVFTALVGTPRRRFAAHSGPAVNLAARLMQAAGPAEILVGPATWRAAGGHLRARGAAKAIRVKGRDAPVETRAIAGWRRGTRRGAAAADGPLVGRDRELATAEGLLDDLAGGAGRPLFLEGDPGTGKTRLVREIVERATTRGIAAVVVDADDHPHGKGDRLWRDLVAAVSAIPARTSSRRWSLALTDLLPGAAEQLPTLGKLLGMRFPPSGLTRDLAVDIEADMAAALLIRAVATATGHRRHLIVVENAHQMDTQAQQVLGLLARELPAATVALLVTRRGGALGGPPPPAGLLQLGELSAADVTVLARDTWSQSGAGTPPGWLPEAVLRRSGGNPLFVRTVTTWLAAHWEPGQPPPPDDFAAGDLAHLLGERFDRLPAIDHQFLTVVAVASRPCSPETVANVLPESFDPAHARACASRLVAAGLLEQAPDDTRQRYRLPGEVMRSVLYGSMSHAERDQVHLRLAEVLGGSGADAVEVAEHLLRSGAADPGRGRHWYPLAARSARSSWSVPQAIAWWQRALPLLAGADRDDARVELVELLLVGGRPQEVLDLIAADAVPTGVALSARWLHAEAEAALVSGDLDRSVAAVLQVLQRTAGSDELRHQRGQELLVRVLCERGDTSRAAAVAEDQLARARSSGNTRAVTTAHASLGAALLLAGSPVAAARNFERALTGATAAGDVVQQVHVLSDLAGCRYLMADHAECVRLLARARAAADAIGYRRHLMFNLTNEAQLRAGLGDPYATACAAVAVGRSLELGDLSNAANAVHAWLTADPRLSADPRHWSRLLGVDTRLGRRAAAAEDRAALAVAEARSGHNAAARTAADVAATAAREVGLAQVARRSAFACLLAEADTVPLSAFLARLSSLTVADDLDEIERAELGVERWRATRDDVDRESAAALLHAAFAVEPSAVVRGWFREVGTQPPPPPDPLPAPVGIGQVRTTRSLFTDALTRLEDAVRTVPQAGATVQHTDAAALPS